MNHSLKSVAFITALLFSHLASAQSPISISFDFKTGGGLCNANGGTNTAPPSDEPNNNDGLVLPGQVGEWNSLLIGGGQLSNCCTTSPSISISGITFTLNSTNNSYETFRSGGSDLLRNTVLFFREDNDVSCNGTPDGPPDQSLHWEFSGLDTTKNYNIIFFGQSTNENPSNPGAFSIIGHDAGNGIGNPVGLDSENDGNFTAVVPDDQGVISGTFSIQSGAGFSSWSGLQIQAIVPPDQQGVFITSGGSVGIGKEYPHSLLDVNGTVTADDFVGDGSSLTNAGSDDQVIDKFNLNGTTLELSLESDGEADQTVDLASLDTDTDQQKIDVLNLNGTTLEISLQNDGENTKTLDLSSLVPIGTIQMWPTSTPPSGWLICNGASFSSSTYPDLTTVLGTNTLPNFNGRFPLGVGNSGTNGSTQHNISSTGGEEKHQLSVSEMPSHSHGAGSLATSQPYLSENGSGTQDKRDGGDDKLYNYTSITGSTASVGGNQAHNNMPPFYTINFIIKAQ